MRTRRRNTLQYTLFGFLAGLSLIIVATITQTIYVLNLPLTIGNLITAQASTPLLWIIDTSPIFVAIMTSIGGVRQDQLAELTNTYQDQLETQESQGCHSTQDRDGDPKYLSSIHVPSSSSFHRAIAFISCARRAEMVGARLELAHPF